ncbi:MAG TPA: class I SAM-dependent methyltransferase, partial [Ignavibacteria bacterium]
MSFKDHFSAQAYEYSKYRPKYPQSFFEYLSSLTKEHKLVWDCACGNGQASIGLADYYDEVIATDASSAQILHAVSHPKIQYRVAHAENSGLESSSADLITVATAIHWLDTKKFYPEVRRIIKPEGIITVWSYTDSSVNPEINKLIDYFAHTLLKEYWPQENINIWNFEEAIEFPFDRIQNPPFILETYWALEDYLNYIF